MKRQWAVGGARLSFTYGHPCSRLFPWADRCDRGHNLTLPRAIVAKADGRQCRACRSIAQRSFYEREKAEAARAGMGVKAWKLRRAAMRTGRLIRR